MSRLLDGARPYVAALRPAQWLKNAIVLLGPAAAGVALSPALWPPAIAAVVCACLAASAGYLVNDVCDRQHDRRHPAKAVRPVVSGAVTVRTALWLAVTLSVCALVLAAAVSPAAAATTAVYLAGSIAYSLWLRAVPVAEILVVGALFSVRVLLGAAATTTQVGWQLTTGTFLGAVLVVTLKRRSELLRQPEQARRPVLARYEVRWLLRAGVAAGVGMIGCVLLWAMQLQDGAVPVGALAAAALAFGAGVFVKAAYAGGAQAPETVVLRSRVLLTVGTIAGVLVAAAGALAT